MMENSAKNLLFIFHGGPALESNYLSPSLTPLEKELRLRYFNYAQHCDFDGIVASVVEEIDSHGEPSYDVLCHSWGSGLFLAAHPKLRVKPRRVIIVTPLPLRAQELPEYFTAIVARRDKAVSPAALARIKQIENDPNPALDAEYCRLITPAYVCDPKQAELVDFSSYRRAEATSVFQSMGDFDYRATLRLVPEKTLLLLGEHDFLSLKMAEPFRAQASRTHNFLRAGHCPFVECPAEFQKEVLSFLQDV